MKTQRDVWIDNIKVISCILVALGHFLQSMVRSGFLPGSDLYLWFNQTIYYFHVPLFFICSGYLYQGYSRVDSVSAWRRNVRKKGIALGIPYMVFSAVTWVLKTVFSDSVNEAAGGFFTTLLLDPLSPYWFLYTLFFIFAVTPTFSGRKMAAGGICLAALLKLADSCGIRTGVYALDTVMAYEIWFVMGMCLSAAALDKKLPQRSGLFLGAGLTALFLLLSVFVYTCQIFFIGMEFLLGLLACGAVILWMTAKYAGGKNSSLLALLSRYTLPIFLMHTIFAAGLRAVLQKLGIDSPGIHVFVGLAGSFAGPILAAEIMKYLKWPEFFLYPGKFLKIKSRS